MVHAHIKECTSKTACVILKKNKTIFLVITESANFKSGTVYSYVNYTHFLLLFYKIFILKTFSVNYCHNHDTDIKRGFRPPNWNQYQLRWVTVTKWILKEVLGITPDQIRHSHEMHFKGGFRSPNWDWFGSSPINQIIYNRF